MKRTLALVLALVMVLGMMAIPASADFTDSKDVKYTEAVDVVSACGIINGFEDGSFDPHGNLTREQAAKIVAYMRLGQKNADALKATSAPFEDVAANRWSAGFISYCVNEGIINGRSDKIFDPTGNVTAFEFAKLMLGALGYDSAIEEYTGASWAINVGKTALDIDLFDGNDGVNYNEPATREEAALYILNTLQADLVEYDQKGTNIDLGNGITINTGASKAEVVTTKNSNGGNMGDEADNNGYYTYQFAEKYFEDLELDVNKDDFMRPANVWTYDKTDVGTYADEPEVTYTAKVKGEQIYKDLGKPKDATKFTYYVNGVEVTDLADLAAKTGKAWGNFALADSDFAGATAKVLADMTKKIGGNGVLVEVFEDGDNYIVSIIPSYAGEITGWKAAKGADDEYVTVSRTDEAKVPADLKGKYETDIFSEDDASDNTVVIYTYSSKEEKIESVIAADVATGIVTATKGSDGFTLDGTSYKYAASYTGEVSYDKDSEDKLDVYMDAYGYVIHSSKTEGDTKDSMLVVDVAESGDWATKTYSAKVVFPGSTSVEIVTLKDATSYNALAGKMIQEDPKDSSKTITVPAVAEYSKSSGKYVVAAKDVVAVATTDTTGEVITSGKAMMDIGTTQGDIAANSETIFLFVKPDSSSNDIDDYKYTTYTGIKNVPDVKVKDTNTKVAYIADKDGNYAEFVVVFNGSSSQTASDELYFVHASTISKELNDDSHDDPYYTVKMYNVATGDVETIELTQSVGEAISAAKTTDLFITGYTTDDGLVDSWDLAKNNDYTVITSGSKATLEAKKGNLIVTNAADSKNDGTYGIASDATAYLYSNDDKTVDATSITSLRKTSDENGYTFYVVLNDDEQAVTAFVLDD